MSDSQTKSQSLSEIGHLFLSSLRTRQTEGAPMPRRQPPGAPRDPVMVTIPLRERERAVSQVRTVGVEQVRFPPITAILCAHLSSNHRETVVAYARHLAGRGQRIGLIELEAGEFRVTSFEKALPEENDEPSIEQCGAEQPFDARTVREGLAEMSWDIDRWLLLMPTGRALEAKCLLRDVSHWVLLSTCDHEGVVSCYRTLKGLNPGGEDWPRPKLTLALLNCADEAEAESVHRKLSGVCRQFLGLPLEAEAPVIAAREVTEHQVLFCRVARAGASDKAGAGAHWQVVAEFIARTKSRKTEGTSLPSEVVPSPAKVGRPMNDVDPMMLEEIARSEPATTEEPARVSEAPAMRWTGTEPAESPASEVIELPDGAMGSATILKAVLRNETSALIECPVTPPMCPEAKLAVSRDRKLVLLAVGRQGLADLRTIGRAYQWMCENRALIAMAMPQMSIDTNATPQLRMLVDHADANAAILQPMLQAGAVTVQAYRRLRWGGRNGLLLEAA